MRKPRASEALPNAPQPPKPLTPSEITQYLDYACDQLKDRRAEVIAALEKTQAAYPRIDDDEALGLAAENMRMAAALNRTGEDRRKEHKEPFLSGGRTVDGWFKTWGTPLLRAMEPVQATMNDYGARKLAQQQAEALAAKRLADAEAERAAEVAAEALRNNRPDEASAALDQVTDAAEAAERADDRVNARPADLTRTHGAYGAVASVRQVWGWEVSDLAAVPREYLMLNPDAIKAVGKQRDKTGKPIAVIPGIAWVASTKMGVR